MSVGYLRSARAKGRLVDLLRDEGVAGLRAVVVTGGDWEKREGGVWYVPKKDVIHGLQVMVEKGELQIARGMPLAGELRREMASLERKVTSSGNEVFGAWRSGTHDDLVFAVGLSCWGVRSVEGRLWWGFGGRYCRFGKCKTECRAPRWLYGDCSGGAE